MNKQIGTLQLIITNECNLDCVYCYENHREKNVISFEIAKENITQTLMDNKYSSVNISLFGGEPFLYFDMIKEICEWTWSKKWNIPYIFNCSTNGTVFNEEIKNWVYSNRDKIVVILSLDGGKVSQNINRSNSFDLIDLNFFSKLGIDSAVKMTISEQSLPNLFEDVKFIHSLGFKFSDCNLAMGINWSNPKNMTILKIEMEKLLDFYKSNIHLDQAQIINMGVGKCENNKVMQKWCGVGRELMTINVDGKKFPCNFITPMSFNDSELEMLLKTDFTNIREILDEDCFANCYLYPVCPTCYGADYLLTKSINKKDRTICDLVKVRAFYSSALKAHKILNENIEVLTIEEKGQLHKTIKAIIKISELYAGV